ncbi:hypothetical protein [Cerasicoccus maritimus]|uniref:hypothetical protein n=1 Tax=Cerasicoccus maritimus TaxID=490089 RepID=UPI002852AB67|nr:hypothetical protein [Cerasicoccus maritimus]
MDYRFYLVMHFAGILLVFLAFGSMIARSALQPDNVSWRKFGSITSGVGLLFLLVGGFGLLAKFNYGFPGWAMVKFVIWLALGALTAIINKKPHAAKGLWWTVFVLGFAAVLTVTFKPLSGVGIKPHRPEPVGQVEEAVNSSKDAMENAAQ